MLSQVEKERFEKLENETAELRNQVAIQQIVISGLLHSLFRNEPGEHSAFFSVLREELNTLPFGSFIQQDFTHSLQKWIDRYR